jgi:hypothetical protein
MVIDDGVTVTVDAVGPGALTVSEAVPVALLYVGELAESGV